MPLVVVFLYTARTALREINSNTTDVQATLASSLTAFNTNGFNLGSAAGINVSADSYVSWSFREQAKFFDVVTYSGNGVAGRTVAHNLGSVPGCIIVKRLNNAASNWVVYHRSNGATPQNNYLLLNDTLQTQTALDRWNNTAPTSTIFTVGDDTTVNGAGDNYVAYLFAHNAGGFGLTGTDNVVSCGSFTTNSSGNATVSLGYEPQWVLIKRTDSPSEWHMLDNMRGFSQTIDAWLRANSSAAENSTYKIATPTATGFVTDGTNIIDPSSSFIYIAIRRGPMKVPTSGTSVFAPFSNTTASPRTLTTNFVSDLAIQGYVNTTAFDGNISSRLQNENYMRTA